MKLKVSFHKKQMEVWKSDKRIIAFIGGIGSGKTYLGKYWLLREIIRNPREDFLVVAPTYGMLQKIILPQMLDLLKQYIGGTYFALKKQYVTKDGARIVFGSAENPIYLEGVHYKAVWFDEAGQTKRDIWDVIRRRTSFKKGRILLTTTPYFYNWLKFEVYDEWLKGDDEIEVVMCKSSENPFFPKDEYERAKSSLPNWQFTMFYEGEFVRPSGLVYQEFNMYTHVKELDIKEARIKIAGFDWGFNEPSAVVFIALTPDNLWYVYDEIYKNSTTPSALIEEIKGKLDDIWRIYVDPSQPGLINMLQPKGVAGNNDMIAGISHISNLFKNNKLFISPKCDNLISELFNYRWDEKKDRPINSYNHALDALRYALYTYNSRPMPRISVIRSG